MMKKVSVGILVFMLTLYLQQGEAEASELVITATQDRVPIYDHRNGEFTEMGKLRLDESMIATQDFESDWWQVKFGNAYGYIKKEFVQVQNNVEVSARE